MADASTAGTLIGAVLETAGYLTQAEILVDFKEFFNSAGGLIYTLAVIGGVISFALFGSFRAVRYLIVGPAMFWFLIGPTSETNGVMWKVAENEPRTMDGSASAEEAAKFSRDAARESKGAAPEVQNRTIKVSSVFKTYTQLTNNIVAEFVRVILQYQKKDEDLLFSLRNRAYEYLTQAQIDDPELLEMMEGNLLRDCGRMINAALALSNYELSYSNTNSIDAQIAQLSGDDAGAKRIAMAATRDSIISRRHALEQEWLQAANFQVRPTPATRVQLEKFQSIPGSRTERILARRYPSTPFKNIPDPIISCEDLSNVTQDAIWEQAPKYFEEFLQNEVHDKAAGSGAAARDSRSDLLCREIAEKLGKKLGNPANDKCDLVPYTVIFLWRNALSKGSFSRTLNHLKNSGVDVQGIKDRMQFIGGVKKDVQPIIGLTSGYELVGGLSNYESRLNADKENRLEAKFRNKITNEVVWLPIAKIGQIEGHLGASFGEHQKYQTRGLKQGIYTWALQLPYWQGTLLYFLCIAYPFLALIVLIPGRAAAFMSMPLAWLWVKSWDVGWAVVMVFEKVLWNIFPPLDLQYGGDLDPGESTKLPLILREAFKVDPTFNTHAYFFLLSTAMFSVPILTGYAILKSKRSVLSSFTDGPRSAQKDAQELGEGGYGVVVMNKQQNIGIELGGAAEQSVGKWGEGLTGGGRMQSALTWGTAAMVAEGAGRAIKGSPKDADAPFQAKEVSRGEYWNKNKEELQEKVLVNAPDGKGGYERDLRNPAKWDAQMAQGEREGRLASQNRLAENVTESVKAGIDGFMEVLSAEVYHDATYRKTFHPVFGRYGAYQMMAGSMIAAIDGSGGYELQGLQEDKPYKQLIALFSTKVGVGSEMVDDILGELISKLANSKRTPSTYFKGSEFEQPLADQMRTKVVGGIAYGIVGAEVLDSVFGVTAGMSRNSNASGPVYSETAVPTVNSLGQIIESNAQIAGDKQPIMVGSFDLTRILNITHDNLNHFSASRISNTQLPDWESSVLGRGKR